MAPSKAAICSSALAMSRSQMVSCRRAACWARLPRLRSVRSSWGFSALSGAFSWAFSLASSALS